MNHLDPASLTPELHAPSRRCC